MATDAWERLRAAPDYRVFLETYLEAKDMNRTALAKAAGFGRGFPGDVISGRRRLTLRSCRAFEGALKLPPAGRKLFRCLVAKQEPDLFPELTPDRVEAKIQALRRPWEKPRREKSGDNPTAALAAAWGRRECQVVYAAAGQPGQGATLAQLQERTRLPEVDIAFALRALMRAGLLRTEGERYEPSDTHLFLHLKRDREAFANFFRGAAQQAATRAPHGLDSNREFFLSSAFCVREDRLPELKTALRELMLGFVDGAIEADGDRVVHLVTALHL